MTAIVRVSPIQRAPYSLHEVVLDGVTIWSQLSPMTDAEVADRVDAYLRPRHFAPVKDQIAKRGPKPRGSEA